MRLCSRIAILTVIAGCPPACAGGLLGDISKQLQFDVGKSFEKSITDTGKAIEKAAQDSGKAMDKAAQDAAKPIHMVDAKLLAQELFAKTNEDLFSLSVLTFPCFEINCRGLSNDVIRTIISQIKTEKQNLIDLEVRKSQAIAAVVSAVIALLSLLISIASFYKASRAATANASPFKSSNYVGTVDGKPSNV